MYLSCSRLSTCCNMIELARLLHPWHTEIDYAYIHVTTGALGRLDIS
jgi:hypothetical protein